MTAGAVTVDPPLRWRREGADWPHREASRFVLAGGLRWHVQRWGDTGPGQPPRPVALLLHGTGASTHSWRELAPRLAATHHVVAPDLPGHGFSQALPAGCCSLPGMAAALRALLQGLGLQPTLAVGHSAGAALVLRLALDGALPGCVPVGLNAALLPFGGLGHQLYAGLARLMAGSAIVPWLAAWRARDAAVVRRLVDSTGSVLDDAGVALYGRLLRDPEHVAEVLRMMANWDLTRLPAELHRLPELHLVVATRDAAVPPRQAEQVARGLPGVRIHVLQGLGHLAHEEAPQTVAELLGSIAAGSSVPAPPQGRAAETTAET